VKTLDSRTMRVTFIKTGPRRYGVLVERDRWPDVGVNPAPGYDDYLPHDLLHFVAEAEWRMDGAVFGQLASGGDAGIFLPLDPELLTQTVRDRKRRKRLSAKPKGRRSELLIGRSNSRPRGLSRRSSSVSSTGSTRSRAAGTSSTSAKG